MRIALHTRVRGDRIAEYELAHREVPAELTAAIRAAGAASWTIWRSGTDLFHVIDCADYAGLLEALRDEPVNVSLGKEGGKTFDFSYSFSGQSRSSSAPIARAGSSGCALSRPGTARAYRVTRCARCCATRAPGPR